MSDIERIAGAGLGEVAVDEVKALLTLYQLVEKSSVGSFCSCLLEVAHRKQTGCCSLLGRTVQSHWSMVLVQT